VDDTHAGAVVDMLLSESDVQWIGLGARDTLRLEAGLCLYGHELDETTTPIEADLKWTIGKRRRTSGGFLGADKILSQMQNGAARKRVGIRPDGRAIARDGVEIQSLSGQKIGLVTSGTFGPTVNGPIAIGYVDAAQSAIGNKINLMVRGAAVPASVAALPFVPYRYYRG
jgi:aminomethyltransferase